MHEASNMYQALQRPYGICPISKASWRVAFLIDNKISILGLWQRTETLYKKWC